MLQPSTPPSPDTSAAFFARSFHLHFFLPHTRTNRHTSPLALALRCCSSALSAVSIRNLTLKVGPEHHYPAAVMAASFAPAASPMLAPHAPSFVSDNLVQAKICRISNSARVYACMQLALSLSLSLSLSLCVCVCVCVCVCLCGTRKGIEACCLTLQGQQER